LPALGERLFVRNAVSGGALVWACVVFGLAVVVGLGIARLR
jgi:hypothetical protein